MSEADAARRQLMAKAVSELRDLRARVRELEAARDAPVAIVGMGVRFPGGASDPRSFWELLRDGRDATSLVPASRWDSDGYYDPNPDAPGKMSTRRGAFLGSVEEFDAEFFGISPREARSMDPQQRLLLEVAWEALEHAGISPHGLLGRSAGVYVGICSSMHTCNLWDLTNLTGIDAYHGTGSTFAVAAGRLSHFLGVTGPSLAVDTACSSSLVALHLACQSLRAQECELALVGGVNLLLGPQVSVSFSKARMLSPDGRCKPFSASADGYGRGEGCGALVLRRLDDALERGERVLGVVRGSAVNHDGHSSSLTVPHGPAQVRVIREALRQAGLAPDRVSYLEAHGTGTALGDPIECNALGEVFGAGRTRARPLLLGSVKANIGHLEAAAGISGVIKVLLAFEHGAIPPHPMQAEPSSHVAWAELPLELPRAARPWPSVDGPRVAGISSFGFSGTNAHVVIEEAPSQAAALTERSVGTAPLVGERPLQLLALSARSEPALGALIEAYQRHLVSCASSVADIAFTANVGRAHFAHRACAIGATSAELQRDLERASRSLRRAPGVAPAVAFLFTGQGSQLAGVGGALYEAEPLFRSAVDRCAAVVNPLLSRSIERVMFDPAEGDLLRQTMFTQPALFILEHALSELWRAWGVQPVAVLGHSLGEYVAACVAGVMSLDDALKLVVARGRLMQALPAAGSGDPASEPAMVAVFGEAELVAAELAERGGTLSIAAMNGPRSTVLTGLARDVRAVSAALERRGLRVRELAVSHAFHSPLMDPMLDALEAEADEIPLRAPRLPLVSNLSGAIAGAELSYASYFRRHAREPVRFADGMRTLGALGCNVFLEIGPRPALIALGQQTLEGPELTWIPTLSGADDFRAVLDAVAELYQSGVSIDWNGFERSRQRRRVTLPTYPFERKPHPVPMPARRPPSALRGAGVAEAREAPAWFYRATWEPAPLPSALAPASHSAPERWLIWADRQGVGAALASEIERRGGSAQVVPADELRGVEGASRVLAEMDARGAPEHIIHLGSLDAHAASAGTSEAHRLALQLGCVSALQLVQGVARQRAGVNGTPRRLPPRLAFVTSGAVLAGGARVDPAQAPLWGLVRSLALELPELSPLLVDLDPESPARAGELYAALSNSGGELQLALRQGERQVLRLRATHIPAPPEPLRLRAEATYLITGGTGALGLLTARLLAARGARHLVLMARRAKASGAEGKNVERVERELRASGTACDVVAGDVAIAGDVARVLDTIRRTPWALRGVFHAAGVGGACDLLGMDSATLERALEPKWQGAWNLHEACAGEKLEHFVAYASLAGLWGARGQAHYAAANAFLDALSAYRRARGEAGVSIQWGPWDSQGMGSAEDKRKLAAIGVSAMPEDQALACFERALHADAPSVAVADVDWAKLRAQFEARGPRPFFMHLGGERASTGEKAWASVGAASLAHELAALPAAQRREQLVLFLRTEVQRILETERLPNVDQGLFDMGFDSLMAVELTQRLEKALGRRVPSTAIFDHPRINALASYLLADEGAMAPASPVSPPAPAARAAPVARMNVPQPLAIIGMGCRFPGAADTPGAFWDLLQAGRDATSVIPPERWDVDAWYALDGNAPGKMNVRRGGFLSDVAGFDPRFFRIAPRVAAAMDPQHRLLLEVAWEAMEDAALAPQELQQASTAVFVGITSGEYGTLLLRRGGARGFDGPCMTGTPLFSAAGRLSYTFGLHGPSMSVDTACSSSLTALHLAGQSLRQGECKFALVGGVNLLLAPETMAALCRTGALSSEGRCKSFSADADGYARAEGSGVLVLTRLDDALAAGYRVRAVVTHSGVNHNGASGGYTVPNGRAQEDLIRRVWQEAEVSPSEVDYVEAHATATRLGDPVEVRALAGVVGDTRPADHPLLIGSVKTNLGHCEAAAGVAGVIKVVLSLEHEEIPPHLHCENLSPHVPWEDLPVRVARQRTPWKQGERRRLSGVSSFGMGGTNAHALLEAAPPSEPRAGVARPGCRLLCLSARSGASLAEQARRLQNHLVRNPNLDLADVAHTTRIGRSHFAHRACIRAADTQGVLDRLDALIRGRAADGLRRGCVSEPLPKLAFRFHRFEIDGRSGSELRAAYAQAQTWRSFGLAPQAVSGEGGGEHVAACFGGGVSIEAMIEWLAGERRGAPPAAESADGAPKSFSCEVVPTSTIDADWHVVPIDVMPMGVADWDVIDAELAKLHVAGFVIDWEAVSRGAGYRRVGLPTYPFERRAYWIDDALADGVLVDAAPGAAAIAVVSGIGPAAATAAAEGDASLELLMVHQIQMVSRVLDGQLAFLQQGVEGPLG